MAQLLTDMESRLLVARTQIRKKTQQLAVRRESMFKIADKCDQLSLDEHNLVEQGEKLGLDFQNPH